MTSQVFRTATEEDTIDLGRKLGPELSGAVLLIGNLGAGKTTLTKGIVEGRGVLSRDEVSSPTFTLVHQYGVHQYGDEFSETAPVYHVDLYRLDEERQVETLGLQDFFAGTSLVLLEWAERFPALLPANRTEIRIRVVDSESETREISVIWLP